jgi:hypothetical protein
MAACRCRLKEHEAQVVCLDLFVIRLFYVGMNEMRAVSCPLGFWLENLLTAIRAEKL